jgi:membrane associated rhomboid family serine protease
MCGAQLVDRQPRISASRPGYDRETLRFARAVLDRPYIFTIIFLVANFFVFLLMWHSSGMSLKVLGAFPDDVLFVYGAKLNAAINERHQWWRFVTPMFVHVNLIHLVVNMYSLWMVGPYVEKLYGSARFVVFWVVGGIGGVVASYLSFVQPGSPWSRMPFIFKTEDSLSAGASGALFGLVGVLFVFGIKFRKELPDGFKRAFGTGLLPIIMINLFIGYLGSRFIDNAAHLGGLGSGAAMALLVSYRRPGERSGVALTWQILQVAALVLVAACFLKAAQHFRDPSLVQQGIENNLVTQPDQGTAYLLFVRTMNQGQEVFQSARRGDLSEVEAAVAKLEATRAPDFKADQLRRQLIILLKSAKQLPPAPSGSPPIGKKPEADPQSKLNLEYKSWKADYDQWTKPKS